MSVVQIQETLYMRLCIYVYTYMCMYLYMYMYIYIYIHMYMFLHILCVHTYNTYMYTRRVNSVVSTCRLTNTLAPTSPPGTSGVSSAKDELHGCSNRIGSAKPTWTPECKMMARILRKQPKGPLRHICPGRARSKETTPTLGPNVCIHIYIYIEDLFWAVCHTETAWVHTRSHKQKDPKGIFAENVGY